MGSNDNDSDSFSTKSIWSCFSLTLTMKGWLRETELIFRKYFNLTQPRLRHASTVHSVSFKKSVSFLFFSFSTHQFRLKTYHIPKIEHILIDIYFIGKYL